MRTFTLLMVVLLCGIISSDTHGQDFPFVKKGKTVQDFIPKCWEIKSMAEGTLKEIGFIQDEEIDSYIYCYVLILNNNCYKNAFHKADSAAREYAKQKALDSLKLSEPPSYEAIKVVDGHLEAEGLAHYRKYDNLYNNLLKNLQTKNYDDIVKKTSDFNKSSPLIIIFKHNDFLELNTFTINALSPIELDVRNCSSSNITISDDYFELSEHGELGCSGSWWHGSSSNQFSMRYDDGSGWIWYLRKIESTSWHGGVGPNNEQRMMKYDDIRGIVSLEEYRYDKNYFCGKE